MSTLYTELPPAVIKRGTLLTTLVKSRTEVTYPYPEFPLQSRWDTVKRDMSLVYRNEHT
eukprot:gene2730-13530_t